ncbi:hypothetical protein D9756_003443 [Leucocoprinus leucothites]|uniref:MFS general substrate transporter n=1 Tax=Leucocoprinus leucothites TaxID=201217 RepID=A0A8H5G7D3_9AGAR|nr:hypothetical protein D9756_003443 [Leucoagaricus leucothites]
MTTRRMPSSREILNRAQERLHSLLADGKPILTGVYPHTYLTTESLLIPMLGCKVDTCCACFLHRGITASPRIQVYKAIACRALNEGGTDTDFTDLAECGSSEVQARAARIQAAVVTVMSVLSAISTGFWSRLGDTHGRKPIFILFISGALLMEAVFVLVMRPNTFFARHAERLILVGPIAEGFVGGLSTFNGVFHAYVTDCTRPGSRSRIFSTIQGIVFVGLSFGPWFSGLFLPKTGYSDSFFYSSITLLICTILYLLFICPESKFPSHEEANTYSNDFLDLKTSPIEASRRLLKKFMTALLSPIAIFSPKQIPGTNKRSWNMTLVGLSFFIYCISIGIYAAKYLYAQHVYSWTTAQLGYYMSTLWISRALNLLVVLPIIIHYLKPKRTLPPGTQPSPSDIAAELVFDKYLAQISLFVDGLADALVAAVSNNSQPLFVALSCMSSFTSGGNPALQSLGAICLHVLGVSDQAGTLFGALGVLNAIAHIISPTIYAATYGATVASFPQAIFVLAACLLFIIVILLAAVWPSPAAPYTPANTTDPDVEAHSFNIRHSDDVTVVDGQESLSRQETDRGRTTTSAYKYSGVGSSPPRTQIAGAETADSRP